MKKVILLVVLASMIGTVQAVIDGQADNERDDLGYYYPHY